MRVAVAGSINKLPLLLLLLPIEFVPVAIISSAVNLKLPVVFDGLMLALKRLTPKLPVGAAPVRVILPVPVASTTPELRKTPSFPVPEP